MAFKLIILSAILALTTAGYVPQQSFYAPAVVAKVVNPSVDAVASTQQNVVRSFGGTVSQYSKSVQTPYSSVHKQDTRISNNIYTPAITKTVYTNNVAAPVFEQSAVYQHTPAVYKQSESVSYAAPMAATHSASIATGDYSEQHVSEDHEETGDTAHVDANTNSHSSQDFTNNQYGFVNHALTNTVSYAAPAVSKTVSYTAPAETKTVSYAAPAVTKTVSYPTPAYVAPATYSSHYASAPPTAAVYTQSAAPTQATVYQHSTPTAATTLYNHGPAATTYSHNSPAGSAYGTTQTVRYSPANMVSHMSFNGFGTQWGY